MSRVIYILNPKNLIINYSKVLYETLIYNSKKLIREFLIFMDI